jgi:O-methyltransferase involved in polyketide biosynthesis
MDEAGLSSKDYSSISPSARSLLFLKAHTNIPFAKEAVAFITNQPGFTADADKKDFTFWARVVHFEMRYLSINQLMEDQPLSNILELSSGFSFRSLATTINRPVHYIDTDLADVIKTKKELIAALQKEPLHDGAQLEILPLNAVDEKQFTQTVNRFSGGNIAIINEGLLMYLNIEEKEKLCSIIHNTLKEHGGYWATADIYIRNREQTKMLKFNDRLQAFFEQHNIEENKFESFEAAEAFFIRAGFVIDKEAEADYSKASSITSFLQSFTAEQEPIGQMGRVHASWRLKVAT